MRDGLDPLNAYQHLLRGWWKIVLLAVIGGLAGLGITYLRPPMYQAEAVIHASIDFTEINYENMVGEYGDPLVWTQFEEDLALQVVQRVLLARLDGAYRYASGLDPALSKETFEDNYQIERYLGHWYLRYRHENPRIAKAIVNFWVERGLQTLEVFREDGRAESFVMVDLVTLADEPPSPIYFQRHRLVLAGTAAGFFAGILWVDFGYRFLKHRELEV